MMRRETQPRILRPVWKGWRRPLAELPVVALDIETTGLDPGSDRIIEIALIDQGGVVVDSLVDPTPDVALPGVHGLEQADLGRAPSFGVLMPAIRRAIAGRLVVAHWADFDVGFLRAECNRAGWPLPPVPYICTAELADSLALGHESRSLAHACERLQVPLEHPHTAACDAAAASQLFAAYAATAGRVGHDLTTLPLSARVDSHAPASWRHAPLRLGTWGALTPGECRPRLSA